MPCGGGYPLVDLACEGKPLPGRCSMISRTQAGWRVRLRGGFAYLDHALDAATSRRLVAGYAQHRYRH